MPDPANRTVHKSARMLLLLDLRAAGLLTNLSGEDIARALGVNRSTICRDLHDLSAVEAEYHRLLAVQPWLKRQA